MPWNPEFYQNVVWNTNNLRLKKNKKIKKKVRAQASKRASVGRVGPKIFKLIY